jgi:brefeldin A-resistance guanine nucleotide exchange factor 1
MWHSNFLKSLELLQYILNTVPTFYGVSLDDPLSLDKEDEVVKNYILPTLKIIRKACQDHRIAVHNNALACLQRALSPELYALSTYNSVLILHEILFNLLTTLLEINPTKGGLTKDSLENIRLRAISILCKTFLQYMPKLILLPSFKELWTKIMKYVQDYMNADNSELLVEAVPETLKNMLVVMHTNGVLIPPEKSTESTEESLWNVSWKTIDSFCPKLKEEFAAVTTARSPVVNTNLGNPTQ